MVAHPSSDIHFLHNHIVQITVYCTTMTTCDVTRRHASLGGGQAVHALCFVVESRHLLTHGGRVWRSVHRPVTSRAWLRSTKEHVNLREIVLTVFNTIWILRLHKHHDTGAHALIQALHVHCLLSYMYVYICTAERHWLLYYKNRNVLASVTIKR